MSTQLSELCIEAIKFNEEDARAFFEEGLTCIVERKLEEGISCMIKAIVAEPDYVSAYVNLGTCQLVLGYPEKAAQNFWLAALISPNNP